MNQKKKIIFFAILISGLIIILSLIYYGRQLRRQEQSVNQLIEKASLRKIVKPSLDFKASDEVYYYIGIVQAKSVDSLAIIALERENFLTEDKELIVRVDQNTRMRKFKMPKYLTPGPELEALAKNPSQTVSLADFAVGQRITVYADKNIKDASEFLASEISAVEYGE